MILFTYIETGKKNHSCEITYPEDVLVGKRLEDSSKIKILWEYYGSGWMEFDYSTSSSVTLTESNRLYSGQQAWIQSVSNNIQYGAFSASYTISSCSGSQCSGDTYFSIAILPL